MGLYHPCYSTDPGTGSAEFAELELYDEADTRAGVPGFDDVTGQPYLEDANADGLGERVREVTVVTLRCKARFVRFDEQQQDGMGNAPVGSVVLTLYEFDLKEAGLLVDGVLRLRANDQLMKLKNEAGEVRVDLTSAGEGYFCVEVLPGETGDGSYQALYVKRQPTGR